MRRALVTCTVLALALLGGCGGGGPAAPTGPAGPTDEPTSSAFLGPNDTVFCGVFDTGTKVDIKDKTFTPGDVTIAVNGEVDWKNDDAVTHVIKFDAGTTCGTVMAGQTMKVRFSAAGRYPYHCTIHPEMKGNVQVN